MVVRTGGLTGVGLKVRVCPPPTVHPMVFPAVTLTVLMVVSVSTTTEVLSTRLVLVIVVWTVLTAVDVDSRVDVRRTVLVVSTVALTV